MRAATTSRFPVISIYTSALPAVPLTRHRHHAHTATCLRLLTSPHMLFYRTLSPAIAPTMPGGLGGGFGCAHQRDTVDGGLRTRLWTLAATRLLSIASAVAFGVAAQDRERYFTAACLPSRPFLPAPALAAMPSPAPRHTTLHASGLRGSTDYRWLSPLYFH